MSSEPRAVSKSSGAPFQNRAPGDFRVGLFPDVKKGQITFNTTMEGIFCA